MLESGISPSQNVGHLEKQDACSGGHFLPLKMPGVFSSKNFMCLSG